MATLQRQCHFFRDLALLARSGDPAAGSWGSLLQVLGAKMAEDVRVGLCAVRRLEGDGARSRRGGITRLEFQEQHVPRPEAEPFVDAARLL